MFLLNRSVSCIRHTLPWGKWYTSPHGQRLPHVFFGCKEWPILIIAKKIGIVQWWDIYSWPHDSAPRPRNFSKILNFHIYILHTTAEFLKLYFIFIKIYLHFTYYLFKKKYLSPQLLHWILTHFRSPNPYFYEFFKSDADSLGLVSSTLLWNSRVNYRWKRTCPKWDTEPIGFVIHLGRIMLVFHKTKLQMFVVIIKWERREAAR